MRLTGSLTVITEMPEALSGIVMNPALLRSRIASHAASGMTGAEASDRTHSLAAPAMVPREGGRLRRTDTRGKA